MSTFNSINTNRQAVYALQTLNVNTNELNGVNKRISTGYRVADSKDDTGAFSVAQAVRSDIAYVSCSLASLSHLGHRCVVPRCLRWAPVQQQTLACC